MFGLYYRVIIIFYKLLCFLYWFKFLICKVGLTSFQINAQSYLWSVNRNFRLYVFLSTPSSFGLFACGHLLMLTDALTRWATWRRRYVARTGCLSPAASSRKRVSPPAELLIHMERNSELLRPVVHPQCIALTPHSLCAPTNVNPMCPESLN